MAARKRSRGKGSGRSRPKRPPRAARVARFSVAPYLTRTEVRELKARAAADLRTISNYVSFLVVEELKRKGRRRSPAVANPGEKRRPYALQLYLTAAERKRLEAGVAHGGLLALGPPALGILDDAEKDAVHGRAV